MALVTVQRSPSPSTSAETTTEEPDELDGNESSLKSPRQRSFSESYFTVKGAALILPQSDYDAAYNRKVTSKSHGGDIQNHLQAMFSLLRPQDTIKVAVKLEGNHVRYFAVISSVGKQDMEESVILGIDLVEKPTISLVIPVWAHTHIRLDGDGGFSIDTDNNVHVFKPVSVQAMWSALQSINKVKNFATEKLYIPRGLTHTWVGYYEAKLSKNISLLNDWIMRKDIDLSYRSTDISAKIDSDEDSLYKLIKTELKMEMMKVDLEEATCLSLRKAVEVKLGMDLKKYRSFIDIEMFEILGQMDSPSKILDYLYLGSEWNASNLDELQQNGVLDILNISCEIDNFFPGILHYMNIREWDVDATDLLKYWKDTHRFINRARKHGSKVLVHCKMGISRSASTVIAYLMKENKWSLQQAYEFTKSKRSIINPNPGFWKQLEMYEGILIASWNRKKFDKVAEEHSMAPQKEAEEGAPPYQSPEDEFLAMKLDPGIGDGAPFIHTEQDIDIVSRSADSTDDSLPDQLSPDPTQGSETASGPINRYCQKHGVKSESGDFPSSDTSDDTDSEELPTSDDDDDDDDEMDNDCRFPPIDKPQINLPVNVEKRQKPLKVPARRTKSEGDKHTLSLDKQITANISREGSAAKFKPDGSWIKLEQDTDDDTEAGVGKEMEISEQEEQNDGKSDDTGIWIATERDNLKISGGGVVVETEEKANDHQASGATDVVEASVQISVSDTDTDQMETSSSLDPYTKENIPWNPGTVRKQKQDLEEKLISVDTDIKKVNTTESETKTINSSDTKVSTLEPGKIETTNQKAEPMECDIGVQSDDNRMETDQSAMSDDDNEREESSSTGKSRPSVYDLEEIDLPEGIVKKTMQEIEERNKLSVQTPGKRLQRSSSLKSKRVTPKAKDRDNERRKTCIAILSPTHQDLRQKDIDFVRDKQNLSALNFEPIQTSEAAAPGLLDGITNQASDDTEEEEDTPSTVKIYKFMGEELTVEEGLVRKQTMDIEHKAAGANVKSHIAESDMEPSLQEHIPSSCVTSSNPLVDNKQTTLSPASISPSNTPNLSSSSPISFGTNASTVEEADKKSRNENVDETSIPKVENIKATFSGEGNMDTHPRITSPPSRKPSRPEIRFDPATLKLIREIGSALLNSPAKVEMEDEREELEGRSLVSHYVRKIERNNTKTKAAKEIVIIDIDSKQNKDQTTASMSSSDSSPKSQTFTRTDSTEIKGACSKWSPVPKKHFLSQSQSIEGSPESPKFSDTKPVSPKWSPVSRKGTSSPVSRQSPLDLTFESVRTSENQHKVDCSDLLLNLKTHVSMETKSDHIEMPSLYEEETPEACSVRNIVSKFENTELSSGQTTPVFGILNVQSPSSDAQFLPGANMAIEVTDLQKPRKRSSTSGLDMTGQSSLQRSTRSQHRQSEPTIHLSERSVMMFDAKLQEMGTGFGQTSEESEPSDSSASDGGQTRPKSADLSKKQAQGHRSYGTKLKLGNIRQSQTLPETDQTPFTWEGKKVRKLYGKTHPLAKLEDKGYMYNKRTNPFYNTM